MKTATRANRVARWTLLLPLLTLAVMLPATAVRAGDGDFVWARAAGGTSDDGGIGVAVDSDGNIYTIGYFGGTVDFDPGPGTYELTSQGSSDAFVSKLDSGGNFVWAGAVGGSAMDFGSSIAVDASGNVYITGCFRETADFDPGPGTFNLTSEGSSDAFVSKLNTNGGHLWTTRFGGSSADYGNAVAIDPSGNVLVTGSFNGLFALGLKEGFTILTTNGGDDVFVGKMDSANGVFDWITNIGGAANDYGESIAADDAGNVYTTGSFRETGDFYPGPDGTYNLTSHGISDIFVSKLGPNAEFRWARAMGGSSYDSAFDISVDPSGNVYTTGYFDLTADFDPGVGTYNLTAVADSDDIFVSKLDKGGDFVWAKAMGSSASDVGYGICTDSSGNAFVTGEFVGTVDFNPGPGQFILNGNGMIDVFLLRLKGGQFPWTMFLPAITNK